MAVLGIQLVCSMVMASLLSKLSPHFSFASWLLCSRLVRYLHPTDAELRSLSGQSNASGRRGKRNDYKSTKDNNLSIPRNLDIQLEAAPVQPIDVLPMRFYTDYQWLVDFSLCATCVYALTELYYYLIQPAAEINLSMLWCLLVIGFCLKVLFALTSMYFRSEDSGEWVMCVVFGFFFLVAAMAVLIVDNETLEFELDAAYNSFSEGARHFLRAQGMQSSEPVSLLTCRIALAVTAGVLGMLLSFPGLRLARMHLGAIKYASDRPFLQMILHVNIIAPLLLTLLWVRPVTRRHLVQDDSISGGGGFLSRETFAAARIMAVVLFCAFRFSLVWLHLQSHLNMACEKVERLRKQAGRINAIDLQKMVAQIFYYLCVVALQYIVPLILLLYCVFVLKTMGGLNWSDAFGIPTNATVNTMPPRNDSTSFALVNLRLVFAPQCFIGFFSFICWWICASWFTSCAFGLVYHSKYFTT